MGCGQDLVRSSMFMQRKDSSVMVMTDITEELNAVDMRSFTHRFCFFHKGLQLYILTICSNKHMNCGSHNQSQ